MTQSDRPVVVGIGELLWDCFPDGRRPGGAPANFAFHARQLGLGGVICSRVGRDALGDELLAFVERNGLTTRHIQRDAEHATGRVTVDLDEAGGPRYTIHEGAAWDHLAFNSTLEELIGQAAAICFGTLAQRHRSARQAIHRCIAAVSDDCRIVYDVNLRQPWYEPHWIERSLRAARIVKLNAQELAAVASLLDLGRDEPTLLARRLGEQFDLDLVCITRGPDGCLLADGAGVVQEPGIEVAVADSVGAGDAFTAALVFAQLRGWDLAATAAFANQVAALVAGNAGAMPNLEHQFSELVRQFAA